VKKLAVLFIFLAACHNSAPGAVTVGAESPEGALTAFIAGAKAQDLQAMGNVWGDSKHLVRDTEDRASLEKRELILVKLLCEDSHRIVSKQLGVEGRQVLQVELKRGAKTSIVKFTTVRGVASRWYIEDIDTAALQEFCSPK
jgi:hypothetical protein